MTATFPFTPFEELMLYQDSRAYPCVCFIRLRFDGVLHRPAFAAAARTALARHPMLAATVCQRRGRPWWHSVDQAEPAIVWNEAVVSERCPRVDSFDLARESGLRLLVTVDRDHSDLLVAFHHACCDGQGIFQFIHDLLIAYANETAEAPPGLELPTLDQDRLPRRGSMSLTVGKLLKMARKQSVGLLGVRQFVMRTPQPLVPHDRFPASSNPPDAYPALCAHHFDRKTAAAFRAAAKRLGVTANDLLTRDLFLALDEFRRRDNAGGENEWLRLMIPISLRRASDRRTPAANVVSSVFLDRRGVDMADAEQLLASVKDEMNLIKRLQLGFTFIFSLYAGRLLPGGLRRTAEGRRCQTSAVFTNLGKTLAGGPLPRSEGRLVCGNVRLDRVEIAPPIAPFMCAAFAVSWYAKRLSITLHYDPRPLTATGAVELLKIFVTKIRQSVGHATVEPHRTARARFVSSK